MKSKIIAFLVYAVTALSLGQFLESIFGASPNVHFDFFIYSAIASILMYGVAAIVSLFTLRFGAPIGCIAFIVSLADITLNLIYIYRSGLGFLIGYRPEIIASTISLLVSVAYSILQLARHFRGDYRSEKAKTHLILAGTVIYAVALIIFANWRIVEAWLFRLRYRS